MVAVNVAIPAREVIHAHAANASYASCDDRNQCVLEGDMAGIKFPIPKMPVAKIPVGDIHLDEGVIQALRDQLGMLVVQPDDFLVLWFRFINLKVAKGPQAQLVLDQPGQPAYIVVHFPPQNIAEQAFFEYDENFKKLPPNPYFNPPKPDPDAGLTSDDPPLDPSLPVDSRLSGTSRLVFGVPAAALPIQYYAEQPARAVAQRYSGWFSTSVVGVGGGVISVDEFHGIAGDPRKKGARSRKEPRGL